MKPNFRLGALVLALAAVLALAPGALAKGGSGGGGGGADNNKVSCATINAFTNTPGYVGSRASIKSDFTVTHFCEKPATVKILYRNDLTGKVELDANVMVPAGGPLSYTNDWPAARFSTPYTLTLQIWDNGSGGKIVATQVQSVTTLADPALLTTG
jgi:hypothetical protein